MVRHRLVLRKRRNARRLAGPRMMMAQTNQRITARVEQVKRMGDAFFEACSGASPGAALDLGQLAGKLNRADRCAAALQAMRLTGELTRLGRAHPGAHALEARAGISRKSLEKMRQQAVSRTDFEKRQLAYYLQVEERRHDRLPSSSLARRGSSTCSAAPPCSKFATCRVPPWRSTMTLEMPSPRGPASPGSRPCARVRASTSSASKRPMISRGAWPNSSSQ